MLLRALILGFFMSMGLFLSAQHSNLNDEFNSPCNLAEWQNITDVEGWMTPEGMPAEHLEEHNISIDYPGELYMMPWTSSWFGNWRGTYLFKEISGDFVYTSEITALNRQGNATLPSNNYSLAGIMMRTPTGLIFDENLNNGGFDGAQNYIFASIGRATSGTQHQLEIKTTSNSSSSLNIQSVGQGNNQIYMRIARIATSIIVLSSEDNVSWQVRSRYNRADFPETVQVGFVTYTDWANVSSVGFRNQNRNILNDEYNTNNGTSFNWNPDLIGTFDFARFDSVQVPQTFEGLELWNSGSNGISNSDLLSFLGYPSTPLYPSGSKIWNGSISGTWSEADNWNGGLPVAGDYIVIPNCECGAVTPPSITGETPVFSGFHLEDGASLSVSASATLNIDLENANAAFVNEGQIDNLGSIIISNASGKTVTSVSSLNNLTGAVLRVEE